MQTVKLLQIGDVHYPDLLRDFPTADLKDRGYPRGVLARSVPADTRVVLARSIREAASDASVAAVLVCGDLTTRGRLDPYEECRRWLRDACGLGDLTRWPRDRVHVVPGNHDIDRALCRPDEVDAHRKFEQIEAAWRADGDELTVRRLRTTRIPVLPSGAVDVHSLNSCLGCHEFRELPPAVVAALRGARRRPSTLHWITSGSTRPRSIGRKSTILPTSSFRPMRGPCRSSSPTITSCPRGFPGSTCTRSSSTAATSVAISAMCDRGVLYLHGHIHEDPVEIVTPATADDSRGFIVSISAPRLGDGFNVIGIVFGRTHLPIGCIVTPYRRTPSGAYPVSADPDPLRAEPEGGVGHCQRGRRDDDDPEGRGQTRHPPLGAEAKARHESGQRRDAPGLPSPGGFPGPRHHIRPPREAEGVGDQGVLSMRSSSPFSTIRFEHEGRVGKRITCRPMSSLGWRRSVRPISSAREGRAKRPS